MNPGLKIKGNEIFKVILYHKKHIRVSNFTASIGVEMQGFVHVCRYFLTWICACLPYALLIVFVLQRTSYKCL